MTSEFGISNVQLYVSIALVILNESTAFYRFNRISKTHDVDGTQIGYFGFTKDTSDSQWYDFESNLGLLVVFQIIFLIGSYIIKKQSTLKTRQRNLQYYNIIVGIGYSLFLHSIYLILQFSILCIFYIYQKYCQQFRYFTSTLWIMAISTLYLNEKYQGYNFGIISSSLGFLDDFAHQYQLVRWNVVFNMILLRILSFSLDRRWSIMGDQKQIVITNDKVPTYRDLVEEHQPQEEYNFRAYLSFIYYAPLLFAGPSVTFNAFNSQLKKPQRTFNRSQIIKYVAKVYFVDLLTLTFFIHFCYPTAIAKRIENISILRTMSLYDLHMMCFMNLFFLWAKFLTIWRITRGWALMDGIEVPENMNRCVYNNYNFQQFWRSWHRSFNQWLIRYIYVPLGGSKYKVFNNWVVFTYVAIWHDFKLDLIIWAWVICLALIPEILVMNYFNKQYFYQKWWFKYLCILGSGIQIQFMCLSNLIGFGSGNEGLQIIHQKYMTWSGVLFIIGIILFRDGQLATIQFRLRERERKIDINKNY